MNNSYSFQFDLGCFPTTIFVMFGYDTLDEVVEKYNLYSDDYDFTQADEDSLALTLFSKETGNCYLLFKDIVLDIDDISSIVHETVHAIGNIFKYYDTPFNEDTQEVYAYTAGTIFTTIMEKVKEKQGLKIICQKRKQTKK